MLTSTIPVAGAAPAQSSLRNAAEARTDLFGARLSGVNAPRGEPCAACVEPGGLRVYRADGSAIAGRLTIESDGLACCASGADGLSKRACHAVQRAGANHRSGSFITARVERGATRCEGPAPLPRRPRHGALSQWKQRENSRRLASQIQRCATLSRRASIGLSPLFVGAPRKCAMAPDRRAAYRRFAFDRFFAALRGAFLAVVFFAFLAFAFFATFLAAFFAFLAMPWLLCSHGNEPQYVFNMSCASTYATEKIRRDESATATHA
jgi:hypothetical protein